MDLGATQLPFLRGGMDYRSGTGKVDLAMWEKTPVAQSIAQRLQERIRSGAFRPGDKIPSQRVLSEELKVSRPTLREALLTLETLGLLRTYPGRGTVVVDRASEPGPAGAWRYGDSFAIADVFQTRILIEPELCRLAAPRMTPETLDALAEAHGTFESAWQEGDLLAHVGADLQFHRLIVDAGPNRMLRQLYYSVHDLLTESQRQPIPNTARDRMAQSMGEHRSILAALRAGDGTAAAAAMRRHIGNTAACAGIDLG